MDVDLYEYFSISAESSINEIKKAYKLKAKMLHPDKNKDNPKAKEEFQKLKEFYDILIDPTQKRQYDLRYKAKLAVTKRNSLMDIERRKLKEELEARERAAAKRRMQYHQHAETERVADRLRNEWEAKTEAAAFAAHQERVRKERAATNVDVFYNSSYSSIVSVKWNSKAQDLRDYAGDFIKTCLSEFGSVTNVVMGKRGNAVVEFSCKSEADDALRESRRRIVGFPDNPLCLSSVAGGIKFDTKKDPSISTVASSSVRLETNKPHNDTSSPLNGGFQDFESDILAKMARFE